MVDRTEVGIRPVAQGTTAATIDTVRSEVCSQVAVEGPLQSLHSREPAANLAAMRPLIVDWPYAVVYWGLFLWAYAPEFALNQRTRKLKVKSTQDAGSLQFVILVQAGAMILAYVIAFAGRFAALPQQRLWFGVGLGMMVAGSLLRRHCFRMLGQSFTAVVVVTAGQTVVERGAYRWVRHPSYTAGALMLTGQILALGNWAAVALIVCAVLSAYAYRVRVEERALVEVLGEPYREYMRRTKRFVPMIL
jgi:protein-S-isoprenylcysteine O-methyltransferase Ste14